MYKLASFYPFISSVGWFGFTDASSSSYAGTDTGTALIALDARSAVPASVD